MSNLPVLGSAPVLTVTSVSGEVSRVLLSEGTDNAVCAPSGGTPMLVLTDSAEVVDCLASRDVRMANRACPVTGAEVQSRDGGLLTMDQPELSRLRASIIGLFTPTRADATRPTADAIATERVVRIALASTAEIRSDYAEPLVAHLVCTTLGLPPEEWDYLYASSRATFRVIDSAKRVDESEAAWARLYAYYHEIVAHGRSTDAGLIRAISDRLAAAGESTTVIVHVIATVSNGFPSVLPVLTRCLTELLGRPDTVAACLRGEQDWAAVVNHLMATVALFPFALPRRAVRDVRIGNRVIPAGTEILPSLIAAGRGGASANIGFGHGPHFCPGASYSRVWITTAVRAFFDAFPQARLVTQPDQLEWEDGTLPLPTELHVALGDGSRVAGVLTDRVPDQRKPVRFSPL